MNRSRFWFYEPQQESERVCLCYSAELIGKRVGFGVVEDLKGIPARIFLHPCQALEGLGGFGGNGPGYAATAMACVCRKFKTLSIAHART